MYLASAPPRILFKWACRRECSATEKFTDLFISSFTISISSCALFFIWSIRTALLSRDMSLSTVTPPCVLNSIPSQSDRSFHCSDWGRVYRVPSNGSLQWVLNLVMARFNDSVVDVICFASLKAILWPSEVQTMNAIVKHFCNLRGYVDRYETNKDYQVFKFVCWSILPPYLDFKCKSNFLSLSNWKLVEGACAAVHNLHVSAWNRNDDIYRVITR